MIFKKKFIYLFLLIFLVGIFFAICRIIPRGYFVGGADWVQMINLRNNYLHYLFSWEDNGAGLPFLLIPYFIYYLPIYFFDLTNLEHAEVIFPVFLNLVLSTFSFYIFLALVLKNGYSKKISLCFSFLYAINPFTYYYYRSSIGYGPFLFIYNLLPVFYGLFLVYIRNESKLFNNKVVYFSLTSFFIAIAFGNMAFFISLAIFSLLLLIFLLYLKVIFLSRVIIKKISFLGITFLFSTAYAYLYQIPLLFYAQRQLLSGDSPWSDLGRWIIYQRRTFVDQLLFNTDFKNSLIFALSLIFSLLFIISIALLKNKIISALSLLSLVVIFITSKGVGIIPVVIIEKIFTLPVINSLRTDNKTYVFLPFLFTAGIALFFLSKGFNLYRNSIKVSLYILVILIFVSVLPFFDGNILRQYSLTYNNSNEEENVNYLTAKNSSIIKIPAEYYSIETKYFKKELAKNKIFFLPYSVKNSIGWENYDKWKYIGIDPISANVFTNPIIDSNSLLGLWNYGKFWNEQGSNESRWLLPFSGFLNTKYLIYHKDVDEKFIRETEGKIVYYENNDFIEKMEDNEYFNLYKINQKYYLPHLYVSQNSMVSKRGIEELPRILSGENWQIRSAVFFEGQNEGKSDILSQIKNLNDQSGSEQVRNEDGSLDSRLHGNDNKGNSELRGNDNALPVLEFRKINPTKYRMRVHGASGVFPVVFSESYHDGWRLYLSKKDTNEIQNSKSQIPNKSQIQNSEIINKYKILDGNQDDQMNVDELKEAIDRGYVTTLGDFTEKTIEHKKWDGMKEKLDYVEKYNIDFVSKNFQGTIQNDNFPEGKFWETWLAQGLDSRLLGNDNVILDDNIVELPEENHLMVNGYANSWVIDAEQVCGLDSRLHGNDNSLCVKNADGTYDFEMVVEFWPQRLFYIGLGISGTTLLFCLIYLAWDFRKRRSIRTYQSENYLTSQPANQLNQFNQFDQPTSLTRKPVYRWEKTAHRQPNNQPANPLTRQPVNKINDSHHPISRSYNLPKNYTRRRHSGGQSIGDGIGREIPEER